MHSYPAYTDDWSLASADFDLSILNASDSLFHPHSSASGHDPATAASEQYSSDATDKYQR